MNLPWHIIKKDLRRFWLGAALLMGLTALKLVLLHGVFDAEVTREWAGRMLRYQHLLLAAQWILVFVVGLAVVHEDPVSDPGSFWEILPVTRPQLLLAKTASLALIGIVPILVVVAGGWLGLGLPWNELGWPVLVIVQAHVVLLLLALAFGSLTRNIAHVIFWLIGVYLVLMFPAMFPEAGFKVDGIPAHGARLTLAFLIVGILFLTCVGVTLNQYLGRSRRLSVGLLCAGIAAVTGVAFLPPTWDAITAFSSTQQRLNAQVEALPVQANSASITRPKLDADATELVRMAIDDRSAPFGFIIYGYAGKWLPTEGGPVFSWGKLYMPLEHASKRAILRALGFGEALSPAELSLGVENTLRSAEAERIRGKMNRYEGQVDLAIRSVSIEGELPLAPSALLKSASGSCRIKRVEEGDPLIRIQLETRDSGMAVDRGFVGINGLVGPVSRYEYVLVNHASRSVLMASRTSTSISAYAYGVYAGRSNLEFVLPRTAGVPDMNEWKLARIRYGQIDRSVRTFRQELRLEEVPAVVRDPSWTE